VRWVKFLAKIDKVLAKKLSLQVQKNTMRTPEVKKIIDEHQDLFW